MLAKSENEAMTAILCMYAHISQIISMQFSMTYFLICSVIYVLNLACFEQCIKVTIFKLKLIYLDFWMPFIFITHVLNHITSDKRRRKALLHYYYIVFALFVFFICSVEVVYALPSVCYMLFLYQTQLKRPESTYLNN